ncbi:MAG: methyltransferase [Proteobacteria bacterium]|nr:methyltransferase [Pseudomonadota bacterium]MCP4918992.1 methyltransferase [Pseudomonadota bacterium]
MRSALHRPEPVTAPEAIPVDRSRSPRRAAERLLDGELLVVTDQYGTGADILDALHRLLRPPSASAPFAARQAFRRAFREASLRLLAPIRRGRVDWPNPPSIGFLDELYPDASDFLLPLVQVQELNGAWQRYVDGVQLAVLGRRVHPFYGTYFPTRTSHLELFATWLSQYRGAKTRAVDVGTGCGVLAWMLCRAGFEHVLATDQNPNAIESVRRELVRNPAPIELRVGDLLGEGDAVDLVVFNPPWIRGDVDGGVDGALYWTEGLFERFFEQARARVSPEGRVVLIYSNVMQLVQPDVAHPFEVELERGRFTLVQKLARKVKASKDADGRRRKTREKVEVWELAPA